VQGLEEQQGKSNYLIGGDPTRWHVNVPHYARVKYNSVYPGIDLAYYLNKAGVEYDFIIAPHANPAAIRMSIRGLSVDPLLHVDASGDLIVQDKMGTGTTAETHRVSAGRGSEFPHKTLLLSQRWLHSEGPRS